MDIAFSEAKLSYLQWRRQAPNLQWRRQAPIKVVTTLKRILMSSKASEKCKNQTSSQRIKD